MAETRYQHDAFISYAAADRAWADKLDRDLTAGGFKIFLDKRLEAGDEWQRALQAALEASRHLIVLWSGHAKQSAWVQQEMARFEVLATQNPERRFIQVNLEGQNDAYSRFFSINELRNAGVYPGAPDGVDKKIWNDLIGAVSGAIGRHDRSQPERDDRLNWSDYAVVIGVTRYPSGDRPTVERAARDMSAWLQDPNGGRLPKDNLFELIVTNPRATPDDINRVFSPLLDNAQSRRRLYIYFAGLGAADVGPPPGQAVLLLPGAGPGPRSILVGSYPDAFRASGAFREVVMIADINWRHDEIRTAKGGTAPTAPLASTSHPEASYFYVVSPYLQPERSGRALLTETILTGLRGAAAGDNGVITSETLSGFLAKQLSPEPDVFSDGEPLVFGTATAPDELLKRERVTTHADDPALIDRLGRRPFAEVIGMRIEEARSTGQAAGQEHATFMVNLHGPWGSGKTTVLGLLEQYLKDEERLIENRWVVVTFNAWRYQRLQPPWWALIQAVYSQSRKQLGASSLALRLRWLLWRARADVLPSIASALLIVFAVLLVTGVVNVLPKATTTGTAESNAVAKAVELALKILTALAATGAAVVAFSRSLVFGSARAAQTYLELRGDPLEPIIVLFKRLVTAVKRPIVIFIDDLDRCDAAYVVQLLEGIQTLFRTASVTYVVAADRKWIGSCFDTRYADFAKAVGEPGRPLGYLFLDKAFQVSIAVPQLSTDKRNEFFRALLSATGGGDAEAMEKTQKRAEARAIVDVRDARTQEELEAKIDAVRQTDPVQEQAVRAAAAKQITSVEALEETEHRLQGFADLLESNPRAMKRFVNAVGLQQAARFIADSSVSQDALARWTLLESRWPLLAEFVAANPTSVVHLAAATMPADIQVPEDLRPLFGSAAVKAVVGGEAGRSGSLDETVVRRIAGVDPPSQPSPKPPAAPRRNDAVAAV